MNDSDYVVRYIQVDGCVIFKLFYTYKSAISFIRSLPSDVLDIQLFKEV